MKGVAAGSSQRWTRGISEFRTLSTLATLLLPRLPSPSAKFLSPYLESSESLKSQSTAALTLPSLLVFRQIVWKWILLAGRRNDWAEVCELAKSVAMTNTHPLPLALPCRHDPTNAYFWVNLYVCLFIDLAVAGVVKGIFRRDRPEYSSNKNFTFAVDRFSFPVSFEHDYSPALVLLLCWVSTTFEDAHC